MKKFLSFALAWVLLLFPCACSGIPSEPDAPDIPEYTTRDFTISGFWAPYEISEESYALYRGSGMNTLLLVNHSATPRSSENQYYLGSAATERALAACEQTGLNAILNYNDWIAESLGVSYSANPFSEYDLYSSYKDIIRGVHIADEPDGEEIAEYGNDVLTSDFTAVYGSRSYFINLLPVYAKAEQTGFENYADYLESYAQNVLCDFSEGRLLSVDFYPFPKDGMRTEWLYNYQLIAELAKEYDAALNFYIQCAEGNEFQSRLSAEHIRMQVYIALCFGAEWISYYCYSNPLEGDGLMYDACMVDENGNPTALYDYVKEVNAEISAFSDAILAYEWREIFGVAAQGSRGGSAIRMLRNQGDFSACSCITDIESSQDLAVGCFEQEGGAEGYMIVNYTDPAAEKSAEFTAYTSGCEYAVIYGRNGTAENPVIVKVTEGRFEASLAPGEGMFVIFL